MNSPTRRFSRNALALFAGVLFSCALDTYAQQIETPDLWDIGTGDKVPAADVLGAKNFGAAIAGPVDIQSGRFQVFRAMEATVRVQQEGLASGDIILGVDGIRVYGWRDFRLASFRNPLSTSMTLLINRDGDLDWVKLHDLPPGRQLGIQFDTDSERDRFLNEAETLGISIADENVRGSLAMLPARAAAELQLWSNANKTAPTKDTTWIQDFVSLYSALQRRQYGDAKTATHQPPVPYFQRLEKFYLGLAAANQPKEVAPDLNASGETPEFYVLALPVPTYTPVAGDLKFSDSRFQILMGRLAANGNRPDAEIVAAAEKYASSGADGLDQYLDQVKAAILDPGDQGGLPLHSDLTRQPVSIQLLQQALADRMKDPTAPDAALFAYAKFALDFLDNRGGPEDKAGPSLESLGNLSPYLAKLAASSVLDSFKNAMPRRLNPVRTVVAKNGNFLGPNAPELYRWALEKVAPAARASGEDGGDPQELLIEAPYAETVALKK